MSEPIASQSPQELIRSLAGPLHRARGWIRALAILNIIGGVVYALTIAGVVIAWLPIWLGVVLYQTVGLVEKAVDGGSAGDMLAAQGKLALFFKIIGIFLAILLILVVIEPLYLMVVRDFVR